MNSIADAALTGARGNSGIIIAQYINGIFLSLMDDEMITISSFAETVKNAVPYAYQAISNPVEGTIITVIREWADAVYSHKDLSANVFRIVFKVVDYSQQIFGGDNFTFESAPGFQSRRFRCERICLLSARICNIFAHRKVGFESQRRTGRSFF